jgi:hypothetical protein
MSGKFVGAHVWADFGDALPELGGPVLAHVVEGAHDNAAGETKYGIQAPDGSRHELAYREPDDRDDAGSGGTFWTIT